MTKVLCESYLYDCYIPPLEWKQYKIPSRIGYLKPSKYVPLCLTALRAYNEV